MPGISEERVRNAVVGHIASKGYADQLTIKALNQQGVDISAQHRDSAARRILIEVKGESPGQNKTLSILSAWGELLSRVSAINPNRIHGLAFPAPWISNVAKLSSPIVAKYLNVHYFFVDASGLVREFTARQLHRMNPKQSRRRPRRAVKKSAQKPRLIRTARI